jgi:hypothetical protein
MEKQKPSRKWNSFIIRSVATSSRTDIIAWVWTFVALGGVICFVDSAALGCLMFFIAASLAYSIVQADKHSDWKPVNQSLHRKIINQIPIGIVWGLLLALLIMLSFNIYSSKDFAFDLMSYQQHKAMSKILLLFGADIHFGNDAALRVAAHDGHENMVQFLLDHGANIHVEDDLPLYIASIHGHDESVKILLDHGADIHAKNDSALRGAAHHGQLSTVKLLIDHGANIAGCEGASAIEDSEKHGYPNIAAVIRSHRPIYTEKSLSCSANNLLQSLPSNK